MPNESYNSNSVSQVKFRLLDKHLIQSVTNEMVLYYIDIILLSTTGLRKREQSQDFQTKISIIVE